MSKGQKDMILMNCQAACTYLPREIFIPCETLSLRELTMLDLELYRIPKNDAVSDDLLSGKIKRLKVFIILNT